MDQNAMLNGHESKPPAGHEVARRIWDEAAEEFKKICGELLDKGSLKSLDDVRKKIENIDKESHTENPDKDKWTRTKEAALEVLKGLKCLITIASKAAALFPIPEVATSLSASALCWVFDIPAAVEGYAEAVNQVFQKIRPVLFRFHIYESMTSIDQALATHMRDVIISVIKLCAHVVKYRQGSGKFRFKERAKSIFGQDTELKEQLKQLEDLVDQQDRLEGTVTLSYMVGVREITEDTNANVKRFTEQQDRDRTLDEIRVALGVTSAVRLDSRTTQTREEISQKCYKGTGEWLLKHKKFLKWTSAKDKTRPAVLLLSGPSCSGKTMASATIAAHLEEMEGPVFVAHYFFAYTTQNSGQLQESVGQALNYMAFQIAKVDTKTMLSLSKARKKDPAIFKHSKDLKYQWERLQIGRSGSVATYYLIFDGLEHLPRQEAKNLLDLLSSPQVTGDGTSRVQFLVSGNEKTFEDYGELLRINITEQNEQDMRIYVETELKRAQVLQEAMVNQKHGEIMNLILEGLPKKSKGSYTTLNLEVQETLRLLSSFVSLDELTSSLYETTKLRATVIEKLQNALSERETMHLNQILKWVLFTPKTLSLDELEAAMVLTSGTQSFISLEHLVQTKYSNIFEIKEGFLLVQNSLTPHLRKDPRRRQTHSPSDEPSIRMTINISNVDRETCGQFFWDLASKTVRDQLKFDFNAALLSTQGGAPSIGVEEFEAHREIVTLTLKYLLDGKSTPGLEAIGKHLLKYLPYRLERLRALEDDDKGDLTNPEKSQLGNDLYRLFKTDEVIHSHRAIFEEERWDVEEMHTIKQWLTDPPTVRELKDTEWKKNVRISSPTMGFLKEWSRHITKQLLRERVWQAKAAIAWVLQLMQAANGDQFPDSRSRRVWKHVSTWCRDQRALTDEDSDSLWELISTWCRDQLGLADANLDSLWYERLGQAAAPAGSTWDMRFEREEVDRFQKERRAHPAIRLYKRALEQKNSSWLCDQGITRLYFSHDLTKARKHAEAALRKAKAEETQPKPEPAHIVDLHLMLGDVYAMSPDPDSLKKAVDQYEIASQDGSAAQATRGQLECWKARLGLADAEEAKNILFTSITLKAGGANMTDIWRRIVLDDDCDSLVIQILTLARGDTSLIQGLVDAMQTASEARQTPGSSVISTHLDSFSEAEAYGILRYYQGIASYTYRVSPTGCEDHVDAALKHWGDCRRALKPIGGRRALIVRSRATAELAKHYFKSILDASRSEKPSKKGEAPREALEKLRELAEASTDALYNDAAALLGSAYHLMDKPHCSRDWLAKWLKPALQVLDDNTSENDLEGIGIIYKIMASHGYPEDTAMAMSLLGQPDLVAHALMFELGDVVIADGIDRNRVLDDITKLAEAIPPFIKLHVPDASEQARRVKAALHYFESLLSDSTSRQSPASKGEQTLVGSGEGDPRERTALNTSMATAQRLVHDRLTEIQQAHTPKINYDALSGGRAWIWRCDGRTPSGQNCTKTLGFDGRPLYHCIYCRSKDFCEECLVRLQEPDGTSAIITACSRDHSWIVIPPYGTDSYRGPRAKTLKVPEFRSLENNKMVLKVCFDGNKEVTLDEWKKSLASKCG